MADLPVPDLPALFPAARRPHFVFTAFGYDRERQFHFRSDLASPAANFSPGAPLTLAEAVHASSNAPLLYFDAPAAAGTGTGRYRFWDGALGGFNNPVLLAVTEALAYAVPRETIRVLTIGSATIAQPLASEYPNANPDLVRPLADFSVVTDLKKIAGAILDDPPDAASLTAYIALGRPLPPRVRGAVQSQGTAGFVRLSPMVRPHLVGNVWQAPRSFQGQDWRTLRDLELLAIEPEQIALLQKLADVWIASDPDDIPNQPVRFRWPDFACELGHEVFAEAISVARAMLGV